MERRERELRNHKKIDAVCYSGEAQNGEEMDSIRFDSTQKSMSHVMMRAGLQI